MEPYSISIILVCYNYGHLLPKALEMIKNQTDKDFELIFVDNGCTDNSVEIINEFIDNNPDIAVKIVTVSENQGIAHGENCGVKAATGKYLMFHDADDWMDYDTIETLHKAALSNNADRVVSAFRDVDEHGNIMQVQELGEEPNFWLYGMQQANLFKRSIYVENDIHTQCFWLDSEKTFIFNSFCTNVAYVKKACYNYLVHTDSSSRNKNLYEKLLNDEYYSFEKLISVCAKYIENVNDSHSVSLAKYQLTRCYYSYIFQFLRDAPLKNMLSMYKDLRKTIKKYIPDYLEATKIGLKDKKSVRNYSRKVTMLSYFLEKFNLMRLALIGYHIVSKFYYFKV